MGAKFGFLLVLIAVAGPAAAQPTYFPVTVDKSFLGAGSDETSAWNPCFAGFPVFNLCPRVGNDWGADAPIALAPLGIGPGDTIRLTASGSFKAGRSGLLFSGDSNQAVLSHQIGLFSASSAITPCVGFSASSCANLNGSPTSTPRVASAIDAGVDHNTGVMGLSEGASFNTDIAQDFYIPTTGVDVVVPAGANYLWVAPWDNVKSTGPYGHLYYGNQTNGGFGVSVEQLTPPVDTDGDGFFDDEDNCPALANAGQEDLDADGVGDACDNCPDEANADQLDTDLDGEGDVCECNPNPGVGSIEILYNLAGSTFDIRNTPFGLGDQLNVIGPGTMTMRFQDDGAGNVLTGGPASVVQYAMTQNFVVSGNPTVTTNVNVVIPDHHWDGNPSGVVAAGSNSGTLVGDDVSFGIGLADYHSTGFVLCNGSLCSAGGLPNGTPVPQNSTITLDLVALDYAAGGPRLARSFATDEIQIPNSNSADTFLTLVGAEVSRVAVPGTPAEICDPDSDLDGWPDSQDNCPAVANGSQGDVNQDGIGDACQPGDGDGDGWPDGDDNCPSVANAGQGDVNNDGAGDACQTDDADGDGWPATQDNCPAFPSPDQTDGDGDGRGNVCDICPNVSDPGQLDSDVDGTGNACDNCNGRFNPGQEDDDADGVGNACDNCLAVSDPNQADPDGDLRGTPCDNCATTANADQADADADGIGNACDPACANGLDDDADGFTDYPADIACHDAGGFNENPRCDDGIDNDNDGFADHDGAGLGDPDPHCVAKPWRDNEGPDSACGLGFEMAPLLLGIAALRRRRGRC